MKTEKCTDPLAQFMRDAYNDGLSGINEDDYPRDFEAVSGIWRDAKGTRPMTQEEIKAVRILMGLERRFWEQGRRDAGKAVAV